jgi:hypothetical protein
MTIVYAWVRPSGLTGELWFASDSRLNTTKEPAWDFGPKVFQFGRSDALIAFEGNTQWAYPLIVQFTGYVESFVNIRERVIDITTLIRNAVSIFNDAMKMKIEKGKHHPSFHEPDCSFLIGGWSHEQQKFVIRRICWEQKQKKWRELPTGDAFCVVGDQQSRVAALRLLPKKGYPTQAALKRNQPLEHLCQLLIKNSSSYIGGAPQIAKVYPHMNVQFLPIIWDVPGVDEQDSENLYMRGRRMHPIETPDFPFIFDPEQMKIISRKEFDARADQ